MSSNLINEGGITGSGKGSVNVRSKEFKTLQDKILEHSQMRSPVQKMEDQLFAIRLQMENYLRQASDMEIIPAGAFLKQCVEILGIKNKRFAAYIGLDDSNLSALFRGHRKINIDLAIKLGKIFKISPRLWLDVQNKNELLGMKAEKGLTYEKYKLEDLLELAL